MAGQAGQLSGDERSESRGRVPRPENLSSRGSLASGAGVLARRPERALAARERGAQRCPLLVTIRLTEQKKKKAQSRRTEPFPSILRNETSEASLANFRAPQVSGFQETKAAKSSALKPAARRAAIAFSARSIALAGPSTRL